MDYKRVLTIQDISCVGQCSMTVALPIISACGIETAVLPSAVLSTHTAGFTGYTFRDLTEDFPKIQKHWENEGIRFDAVYTGYLGSIQQIEYVKAIMDSLGKDGCINIIDPAIGDNGKLYPAFDMNYANAMKSLCAKADVVLPNITEAAILTGNDYREEYGKDYIKALIDGLHESGAKNVVLTGVSYRPGMTGVVSEDNYYEHRLISKGCHGTGDVYASAFTGALLNGKSLSEAAGIAADYVVTCIENTKDDPEHFYGVKFEPCLGSLIDLIRKK